MRLREKRSERSPAKGQTNSAARDMSPAAVEAVVRSAPRDRENLATSG